MKWGVIPSASLLVSVARGRLAGMCGRYASVASRADLAELFDVSRATVYRVLDRANAATAS